MPSPVTASVVVPTHRGEHRLPALLEALARQDPGFEWELLVVVDGVLDQTPELLEAWANRLPLRTIVLEASQGVVSALNAGFDAARGEYLIRCDDDLVPTDSFVADHVSAHEGRHDRAVIGLTRDDFPPTPYALVYGREANRHSLASHYAQVPEFRWIHWAANNSVHRSAWAAVGGFDPRFVYGQDSELGYRLAKHGLTFVIDPALEVIHRGPSIAAETRVPRAYVSGASRALFALVHPEACRPTSTPSGLKSHLWGTAVRLTAMCVRGRSGYRRLGHAADMVIALLPQDMSRRLVALLVEAAGRAGELHGTTDLATYKGQKTAELVRERGTDSR